LSLLSPRSCIWTKVRKKRVSILRSALTTGSSLNSQTKIQNAPRLRFKT